MTQPKFATRGVAASLFRHAGVHVRQLEGATLEQERSRALLSPVIAGAQAVAAGYNDALAMQTHAIPGRLVVQKTATGFTVRAANFTPAQEQSFEAEVGTLGHCRIVTRYANPRMGDVCRAQEFRENYAEQIEAHLGAWLKRNLDGALLQQAFEWMRFPARPKPQAIDGIARMRQ